LKKGGKIAFEVGFDTAQNVEILLKSNGFETKSIIDFNGIARVITGLKNT
jgi:methylase of polypeptide subunit release factors